MRKMAGFRLPASPPPPDLSNLTEEEKEIIQSVLERQKQMEEETNQLQLSLQKEVESYQHRVERKSGQAQADSALKEDNVCEICHKTKFTDGAGKECKYCKLKVCARCGVQVTIPGTKQARDLPKHLLKGFAELIVNTVLTARGFLAHVFLKTSTL
nr:regulating synaptic membrane exocytosis protein 2-like [Pocillopora verrucosa]